MTVTAVYRCSLSELVPTRFHRSSALWGERITQKQATLHIAPTLPSIGFGGVGRSWLTLILEKGVSFRASKLLLTARVLRHSGARKM
jgi:hypothetical protein